MRKALEHFKNNDPIIYKLALNIKLTAFTKPEDPFVDLVDSIISQQLSGKAAATIFGRFKKLFPNEKITPQKLIKVPNEKIRSAGISYGKISYIKGIAKEIVDGKLDLSEMEKLNDEQVIEEMIKLKGVGVWTAEMFLMFTLNRPDIFSAGDLGLQNAVIKHYKIEDKLSREKLLEISSRWSPFRTTASRILWKSLEKA